MSTNDTIKIHVRDCAVPLFVGIYDHEKPHPQNVVINVEASASLTGRYDDLKASDLAKVMDYEKLYRFLTETLPSLGHVPLLESIAEHIIAFCFKDPRVESVRVRLDKPEAFQGRALVGIEMQRQRRAS